MTFKIPRRPLPADSARADTPTSTDIFEEGLLTLKEVAAFCHVAISTVYKWMELGLQFNKLGRSRRIPKRALIEFLATTLHSRADPERNS